MSAAAVVIDDATGAILRKITGDPAMFSAQAGTGEGVFALVDYDGQSIPDAHLIVSEAGEWEAKVGAPVDLELPTVTIEYVAP